MRWSFKLLVLASALAAGAQTPEERNTWFELQGAYIGNAYSSGLKPARGLGLAGGQWLTPHWGWEASLLRDPVQDRAGLWSSTEVHAHGSALFDPLPDPQRWRPFLRLGLGISGGVYEQALATPGTRPGLGLSGAQLATANTASTTTRLSLLAGAGLQTYIGAHGFATFEARFLSIQSTPSNERTESQALLGVGYRWGQASPSSFMTTVAPPAPTPAPAPRPAPEPLPAHPSQVPPPPYEEPIRPRETEILTSDVPLPRKIVLDESVLHFTNGGDHLNPGGEQAVREVAARLRRYRGRYTLEVVGHTSSIGSRAFNRALSLKRAKTVAAVLVSAGIPQARITTRGVGAEEPVASDRTEKGQSRNRRVEILIRTQDPTVIKRRTATPLAERRTPRAARKAPSRANQPAPHEARRKRQDILGS